MNRLSWLGLLVSISLSACTTPSVNESRYRLLPPASTANTRSPALPALTVQIEQAAWLNGSAMHYQLSGSTPALLRYRDSLWADRPAALLHTQLRQRLAEAGLPVKDIAQLKELAEAIAGAPAAVQTGEKIVAVVEYRDGTVIDVVRQAKEV